MASDEINYRRFFEITDLAGVRQEDSEVFEATHALISQLARAGGVDGVRIDHPDGLRDPGAVLRAAGQTLVARPWIVVEKILADHEALPADWPVHGTTGYRYANLLTGVFVDPAARRRFERIYQRFTGERARFDEICAASAAMLIMATTLAAELAAVGMARAHRRRQPPTRDYTASGLRKALAEIAARFPVYRS